MSGPSKMERVAVAAGLRPTPTMTEDDVQRVARAPMSLEIANLLGVVSKMHIAWIEHEKLNEQVGGFELIERMADYLDTIRDSVPELVKLTQALAATPSVESAVMAEREACAKVAESYPHGATKDIGGSIAKRIRARPEASASPATGDGA